METRAQTVKRLLEDIIAYNKLKHREYYELSLDIQKEYCLDDYIDMSIHISNNLSPGRWTECNGPAVELSEPTIGSIHSSARCPRDSGSPSDESVWAVYWGGYAEETELHYTTIIVNVHSRANRDRTADATQIVEMIIDHMQDQYKEALVSPEPPSPPLTLEGMEGINNAIFNCVDDWLETTATTDLIQDAVAQNAVIEETAGQYKANRTHDAFNHWARYFDDVPWSEIRLGVPYGVGCPFTPDDSVVPEDPKKVQATVDCFNLWLSRVHNAQAVIESGLERGTLVHNATTGQYHPVPSVEALHSWRVDYDVPWGPLRGEIVYGSGQCGYPE